MALWYAIAANNRVLGSVQAPDRKTAEAHFKRQRFWRKGMEVQSMLSANQAQEDVDSRRLPERREHAR